MLLQCHLADHGHKNDTLTKTVKPKLSYAHGLKSFQIKPEMNEKKRSI